MLADCLVVIKMSFCFGSCRELSNRVSNVSINVWKSAGSPLKGAERVVRLFDDGRIMLAGTAG